MKNDAVIYRRLILVLLFVFIPISLINCNWSTQKLELKLMYNTYIHGNFIGTIYAKLFSKTGHLSKNLFPILIDGNKLIVAENALLQKEYDSVTLPSQVLSYFVNNIYKRPGDTSSLYYCRIYLICKNTPKNRLLVYDIPTPDEEPLGKLTTVLSYDTQCSKLLGSSYNEDAFKKLLYCQDQDLSKVIAYDINGAIAKTIEFGKPVLLNTAYEGDIYRLWHCFMFDGKTLFEYDYGEPYQKIRSQWEFPDANTDKASFGLSTNSYLFEMTSLPTVTFFDGNKKLFVYFGCSNPECDQRIYTVDNYQGSYEGVVYADKKGLHTFDRYSNYQDELILLNWDKENINCLGGYNDDLYCVYFCFSNTQGSKVVNYKYNLLSESAYFEKPFKRFLVGSYFKDPSDDSASTARCLYTDNEVYIVDKR